MSDLKKDLDSPSEGLSDPTVSDVMIDPANLEHLASDATISESVVPSEAEALVLSLGDLLPDAEGAVVMLTDDNLPVNLVTDETLAGSGVVDQHLSAGGLDVEGLYYYSFANGLTLYSDTDIVIVSDTAGS